MSQFSAAFQVTTFADRPGYQRISSTLWKQREDYCASLIQKAWKFHKLRNTESHTDEPACTGDEEDESSAVSELPSSATAVSAAPAAVAPPVMNIPPGVSPIASAIAMAAAPKSSAVARLPPVDSKKLIEVRSAEDEESGGGKGKKKK